MGLGLSADACGCTRHVEACGGGIGRASKPDPSNGSPSNQAAHGAPARHPRSPPLPGSQHTQLPSLRPGPLPSPSSASGCPPGPAHAIVMTLKSSQFQGSRRNVKSSMQKPRASILMRDSKV